LSWLLLPQAARMSAMLAMTALEMCLLKTTP
jgi:hypothetical protein